MILPAIVLVVEGEEASSSQVCRLYVGDRPVSEGGQSGSLTSVVQVRMIEERLDVSEYLGHIMGRAPGGERNSAVRRNVGVKHLI